MTDKQTVADQTNAEQPTGEAGASAEQEGGAQEDNLDKLLSEYDQATAPAKETTPDTPTGEQQSSALNDKVNKVLNYIEQGQTEKADAQTTEDIKTSVETVLGALPEDKKISAGLAEGFLHKKASSDSRFAKAFEDRAQNPAHWNKVLKATAKEIETEMSVDSKVTNDVEAAAAAVRSASSGSADGEEPNYAAMSDEELEMEKAKYS